MVDQDIHHALALDVGDVRIGVAIANSVARLPRALPTLKNGPDVVKEITKVISDEGASQLVVGLPRGMNGQNTQQTKKVLDFIEELKRNLTIEVYAQDEAATSLQAESELKGRKKSYTKEEIDGRAAVIILEDFLREQGSNF